MLGIDPEKVRQIVVLARMFDAVDKTSDFDAPARAHSDAVVEIFEDLTDGVPYDELLDDIRALSEEEQIHLVALVWIGRGTYSPQEWEQAVSEARFAHNRRTAEYLISLPRLGDYLEDGLEAIEDVES
jgi:hypothetical protein